MSIRVLKPGLLTTVQDRGRCGFAALGVGHAGAMDTVSLRLANALVGNAENAAALEMTLSGPRLRFDADALIALTGADVQVRCNGRVVPMWCPLAITAGCELDLGRFRSGARCYLAVAGGVDTEVVLGSRSSDLNATLGARALAAEDTLTVGNRIDDGAAAALSRNLRTQLRATGAQAGFAATGWSLNPHPWFDTDPQRPIRAVDGSHFAALQPSSQRELFDGTFRISADSNRVGYRLHDLKLALRKPLELVSAGVVAGTVQLPSGGDPIVLMAEAPTCGGYPRIAQVISIDLPHLAQRRPGDTVRFEEISLEQAQSGYLERERALARLIRTITTRMSKA